MIVRGPKESEAVVDNNNKLVVTCEDGNRIVVYR